MKVVVNKCYGGFSLSRAAVLRLRELGAPGADEPNIAGDVYDTGEVCDRDYGYVETPRHDPKLVQVVEEMGSAANGRCANLVVVEVPDDVDYTIEQYDGQEWVAERHRTW